MDGGRALRALLATRLDARRATNIAARLGQGMAAMFALIGWLANPLLILIALFVLTGAAQEAAMADLRATLLGIPVGDVMLTTFRTLAPEDRLSSATELVQHGGQHDLPVMQGDRLIGLLSRRDLVHGLQEGGPQLRVADAMNRDLLVVAPQDMLDAALNRIHARQSATAPAVEDGRLVGLLTADAVAEFINFRAALERAA